MRLVCALMCVSAMPLAARAEVLLTDSFESPSRVHWQQTWGKAEVSTERAQDGTHAVKETLEDKFGLAVWFVELPVQPHSSYRASAWVYVPTQEQGAVPCLAFGRTNWSLLGSATTAERDKWVQLTVECKDVTERTIRLQLFQQGQKAGLGGAVMYWDNVSVDYVMGAEKVEDGIRLNPYVHEGLDVTVGDGMRLTVAPGTIDVDGTVVRVSAATVLELTPPRVVRVRDEAARLTDQEPRGWGQGTPLRGCISRGGTTTPGSLAPASLAIKAQPGPDGKRLQEGVDWRADKTWARIGRLATSAVPAEATVYVDYDYSLMRLDTVAVRSDGKVVVRTGAEDLTVPQPPGADMRARPLCNVYLPYHCTTLAADMVYPLGPPFPAASQGELERNAALIPQSLAKLTAGKDFTLVFWGDSVTCGGDASSPQSAFPLAFTTWLRGKYPQSRITCVNAGTGGWNSGSKLPKFEDEVIARKPDLVVIEFVNDMGFSRDMLFKNHTAAVSRIRQIGGEVIILTPHFTRPDMMGAQSLRTPETRQAVGFFKEFARENQVGLADASRRWAHLWVEGLPYMTLLANAINHPDDRGHWLFVEELQKFFP